MISYSCLLSYSKKSRLKMAVRWGLYTDCTWSLNSFTQLMGGQYSVLLRTGDKRLNCIKSMKLIKCELTNKWCSKNNNILLWTKLAMNSIWVFYCTNHKYILQLCSRSGRPTCAGEKIIYIILYKLNIKYIKLII